MGLTVPSRSLMTTIRGPKDPQKGLAMVRTTASRLGLASPTSSARDRHPRTVSVTAACFGARKAPRKFGVSRLPLQTIAVMQILDANGSRGKRNS